jgi:hypothetical protein
MKITKTVLARIWWLGRGTATMMGVTVMLALTVGLASTALAGTGVGAPFNLGKTNAVNAVSKLVGSVAGPSLTIDNNSTGTGATALDLQVESGKAPIKVNSQAKVANLNADKLDGKDSTQFLGASDKAVNADKLDGVDSFDFLQENERDELLPNDTYVKQVSRLGPGGGGTAIASVDCDSGDKLLGGGGQALSPTEDDTTASVPFINAQGWDYQIQDNGSASFVDVLVVCADFPPGH